MEKASEKEIELKLAPLAAAIMSATPDIREMMDMNSESHDRWKILEQYEQIISELKKLNH